MFYVISYKRPIDNCMNRSFISCWAHVLSKELPIQVYLYIASFRFQKWSGPPRPHKCTFWGEGACTYIHKVYVRGTQTCMRTYIHTVDKKYKCTYAYTHVHIRARTTTLEYLITVWLFLWHRCLAISVTPTPCKHVYLFAPCHWSSLLITCGLLAIR